MRCCLEIVEVQLLQIPLLYDQYDTFHNAHTGMPPFFLLWDDELRTQLLPAVLLLKNHRPASADIQSFGVYGHILFSNGSFFLF